MTTNGEILQRNLKSIGINLEIKPVEINVWIGTMFPHGRKYPGTIVPDFISGAPHPMSLQRLSPTSFENNWHNADYDQLLRDADRTRDVKKRTQLYREAMHIINTEVPLVTWLSNQLPIAVASNIKGVWNGYHGSHLEYAWRA
jgi:ABC-type transport system substrate-binding protein